MTAPTGTRISPAASTGQETTGAGQHLAAETNSLLPASDQVLGSDGTLRITLVHSPPGLAITGDIDESTYCRLLSALETFTGGPGDIHVNLAGVEYCDLAGLRAIIGLTGASGHSSRGVVLHSVPPHLNTVLRILGWDSIPGLTMDDSEISGSLRSARVTDPR
jgi:anti-anti-sigma regulatory factor